ncbi:hypothetical protein JOD43_000133 [Pullulanibacillus pueri]|uniref:Uncharacterized protein n=1 Tax=Pullulanibacillus pueri TaxID=1437324 RepID=A0A8J2ZQQ2_9BACL|nr:hypothetical protein [Pullulanibacillus pueri]MBM7679974.1 hypothetical protein [Pullulanibacillus pueri]GGH73747.1 hypothetical protein GCM10007096_01290 [Pullulanibacillus pueri]
MPYLNEYEEQAAVLFAHFKKENIPLTEATQNLITSCLKEAYECGYENGLADEKEITENPISG